MKEELRKIIFEELSNTLTNNGNDLAREAQISSALTFMQDMNSSINKLESQVSLKKTNIVVDSHIDKAIGHIRQAIESYFKSINADLKSDIILRLREVKIEK